MIKFEWKGGDNTKFVQASMKKLKKIYHKDKNLKSTLFPRFFTKPSKKRHDAISKRNHIRQKFGDPSNDRSEGRLQ